VSTQQSAPSQALPQEQDFMSDLFGDGATPSGATPSVSVTVLSQEPAKLRKLLLSPSGVLFENESLQIGFRSQMEIPGGLMKIVLYYGGRWLFRGEVFVARGGLQVLPSARV